MARHGSLTPATLPISILADSYKAGHYLQYPPVRKMVAYGEFRAPFHGVKDDNRFVFYGIRYLVETYLHRQWTMEDIEEAERFYSTHNAGFKPYPWPKELFVKFIKENNGYFPVRLQALPEGTCAHIHVPVYQLTAENEYAPLCMFLETVLTHVWYPSTVATLSRRTLELLEQAFARSVDDADRWQVHYKLHDFGFRGCTTVEQSVVGGCAHLLSFDGTDTMSAAYYAQFHLNHGKPVACSIPATEHSVMMSWRTEREALQNMVEHFGAGLYSVVMDSYDYQGALEKVVPQVAGAIRQRGGTLVYRPDSGDPCEAVLSALQAGERTFGATVNGKGFKVLRNSAVIQGDGISYAVVAKLTEAVHAAGYSAQNVAFGMGGGLLQRVNRDTMSFATKLCHLTLLDGTPRDVMKKPRQDSGKISLPGVLQVKRVNGVPTVFPVEVDVPGEDLLQVVYDRRPVRTADQWDSFEAVRARVRQQYSDLPRLHDPISAQLKAKIEVWLKSYAQQQQQ